MGLKKSKPRGDGELVLGSVQHPNGKKRALCVCYWWKVRTSPVQSVVCFQGSRKPTRNGSHFKHSSGFQGTWGKQTSLGDSDGWNDSISHTLEMITNVFDMLKVSPRLEKQYEWKPVVSLHSLSLIINLHSNTSYNAVFGWINRYDLAQSRSRGHLISASCQPPCVHDEKQGAQEPLWWKLWI